MRINELKLEEFLIEEEPLLGNEEFDEEEVEEVAVTESIHDDLERRMDSAIEQSNLNNNNNDNQELNENELLRRNFKPLSLSSSYTIEKRNTPAQSSTVNPVNNVTSANLRPKRKTQKIVPLAPGYQRGLNSLNLKRITPMAILSLAIVWMILYHVMFPESFLVNGEVPK